MQQLQRKSQTTKEKSKLIVVDRVGQRRVCAVRRRRHCNNTNEQWKTAAINVMCDFTIVLRREAIERRQIEFVVGVCLTQIDIELPIVGDFERTARATYR